MKIYGVMGLNFVKVREFKVYVVCYSATSTRMIEPVGFIINQLKPFFPGRLAKISLCRVWDFIFQFTSLSFRYFHPTTVETSRVIGLAVLKTSN